MYYTTKRPRWVEGRESFLCVVGTQGRRRKIRNEELEIRNWGGWVGGRVAAGVNARPTGPGKPRAQPGNVPCYINPCRGRFHIGPARGGAGVPRADMESAPTANGRAHNHPGNLHSPRCCNLCRGRCSHRPGVLAGGAGFAGGPWPSPTNRGKRSAKREGGGHPGGRRAGCPHPAGPCGGANAPILKLPRCGGRERPPYGAGQTSRSTG